MSKTIEIKKTHIRNLFLSFILGFGILFGLEHFGKIMYKHDYSHVNEKTETEGITVSYNTFGDEVKEILFTSPLNSEILINGNGFTMYDLNYKDSEFNKYSNMLYFYTEAFKKDILFGFLFSAVIFVLIWITSTFKFRLK